MKQEPAYVPGILALQGGEDVNIAGKRYRGNNTSCPSRSAPVTRGPRLGEAFVRTLTIRAFPSATFPGILEALNHLSLAYRYVLRFLALDRVDAVREIRKYERRWLAKRKPLLTLLREAVMKTESALVDPDAVAKAVDANSAQQAVADDQVTFGYCTATVTVWDRDPVRAHEKLTLVERVINGQGFTTHAEDLNAVEAWLGSLPGHVYANVQRPLLHSLNLAHLLPAAAVWVEGLLVREQVPVTPAVKDEVWRALGSLATGARGHRTLTGLAAVIQHAALRQALRTYTLDGPHGHLLDAEEDGLARGDVAVLRDGAPPAHAERRAPGAHLSVSSD